MGLGMAVAGSSNDGEVVRMGVKWFKVNSVACTVLESDAQTVKVHGKFESTYTCAATCTPPRAILENLKTWRHARTALRGATCNSECKELRA